MIIKNYDGFYDMEVLRKMTNTTRKGVRAFDLLEASRKIGFQADGMKLEISSLKKCHLPCILFVEKEKGYGHYIVLYKVLKNSFIIADPASRIKKIKEKELREIYRNVVLSLVPIKKIKKNKKNSIIPLLKQYLFRYLKDLIWLFIWSFSFIIIAIFLSFLIPVLLRKQFSLFSSYGILLIGLIFIKCFTFHKRNKLLFNLESKINTKLNQDIFSNIIHLPYLYFHDHQTGDILNRIKEAKAFGHFLTMLFTLLLVFNLLQVIAFIFLFIISKELGIFLLVFTLIYSLIMVKYIKKLNTVMEDTKEVYSLKENFVYEALTGYSSVKGNNLENKVEYHFKNKEQSCQKQIKLLNHIQNKISLFQEILSSIFLLSFLIISWQLWIKGYTLTTLITGYILSDYIKDTLNNILNIYNEWLDSKWSVKRVLDIIKKPDSKPLLLKEKIQNIQIKDLTYTYPNSEHKILKNLFWKVKKGEKIMLYGPSGGGKSTLFHLILGYLENDNSIYINGTLLKQYNLDSVRKKVGYIDPNGFLFTGTLRYNLTLDSKVDEDKIKAIVKMCKINNPSNLDDLILENGYNLSSGEKQRILLGRALVCDFEILLIDEGFSQMNKELEREILTDIFNNYSSMTIILISHRLENKDLFDKVYHLNNKKLERVI